MSPHVRFGFVAALVTLAGACAAPNDARVERVLGGLEPQSYIAGQPRVSYGLTERMRAYRVPAVSVAVIDGYRIAWTYAIGWSDVRAKVPASTSTLFQAASMSKAVSAAAILRLFEVRGLNLDADVNTMLHSWHVPASPKTSTERVTMRRLLSHSAGVNVHGFAGYDRDAPLPTLVQVLEGVPPANSEPIRVVAVPGSTTEYSGGGTSIAQQVAVDASGEAFPVFMRKTLLGPLGMTNSTFDQPLPAALIPRAADGYYSDGKAVHGGWHVYPTMAAAGLWTTPADLAKFVIAIQDALRGRSASPIDVTVAREMTTKASQGFGLGPEAQPGYFAHNGANEGFQGEFVALRDGGRGVVVMTNSDNGLQLADEIVHAVATAYGWPVLQPQPRKAIAVTDATMHAVAGTYAAKLAGDRATLEVKIGGYSGTSALFLRSSFSGDLEMHLYAEAPLRFFTLNGGSLAFFRNKGGRVTAVKAAGTTFERLR